MRNNNSDHILQELKTSGCNIQQKKGSNSYMLTDPLGLSSFTNSSKIVEQKIEKQKSENGKNPVKQIEQRLQTLKIRLKKQNRRNFEAQNIELKKILRQKNQQIQKLKEINQLLTESQKFNSESQQMYTLKIQFNQKKIQFIDYIEILSLRFTKQIDLLNKKVKSLERQIQKINTDHNPNHPLLKMSSFIPPLIHEESTLDIVTNRPKQIQQKLDRKRPKIFRKNQQKQLYKLIDHNGDVIQKDQIKLLINSINDFQTKLINLIEKLEDFQKIKINSVTPFPKDGQNLIAQSNKTIQYAKSFLSLLRKIEVVKCDLVDLDSKANSLNESIANNINIQRFQHFK